MCTVLISIGLPYLPLIVLTGKRYVSPHRWESGESIIAVIPAQICPHRETASGINKSEPPAKIYAAEKIKQKPPPCANTNPLRAQNMHATHFVLYLYAIA